MIHELFHTSCKENVEILHGVLFSYWENKKRALCLQETKVEVIILEGTLG